MKRSTALASIIIFLWSGTESYAADSACWEERGECDQQMKIVEEAVRNLKANRDNPKAKEGV